VVEERRVQLEFFCKFLVLYELFNKTQEVQDFLLGKASYYNIATPKLEPSSFATKYLKAFLANEVFVLVMY